MFTASFGSTAEPPPFILKQQHKISSFLTPVSETDMVPYMYSKVTQKKRLCESAAVMLCQTLRCKKNKLVNQL